jgi:hypothetical protein
MDFHAANGVKLVLPPETYKRYQGYVSRVENVEAFEGGEHIGSYVLDGYACESACIERVPGKREAIEAAVGDWHAMENNHRRVEIGFPPIIGGRHG